MDWYSEDETRRTCAIVRAYKKGQCSCCIMIPHDVFLRRTTDISAQNCEILTDTALSLQRHERVGLIVFGGFCHLRQALTHSTHRLFTHTTLAGAGISYSRVFVCPSVTVGVLLKQLNAGSRMQRHTIAQRQRL